MNARAIEDAATRLRDLRRAEWEDLGLAAVALGLAVTATQSRPAFALPLLVGGFVVGALGVRALWRRWDLVDRLAGEREAYVISEVIAYASREATVERRHMLAASIRRRLSEPGPVLDARVRAVAEELEALASELDDRDLDFDPACAVACVRLLSDVVGSPLIDPALPAEELRSRIRRIRSGFSSGRLAA